jgi:ParB-like chromosome segregation protein Spo0J
MSEYEFHPLANVFPLLEGGEFNTMIEDIKAHGLNELIVLYEGKILDGRNRYRACISAGVEPRYREMDFSSYAEAAAYVISANIHRRHLTAEQRRDLIEKLLKADPSKSDRWHAKEIGVSPTTVSTVRKDLEQKGDVSKLDTSTDTKGRKQPRQRTKRISKKAQAAAAQRVDKVTEKDEPRQEEMPPEQQGASGHVQGVRPIEEVRAAYAALDEQVEEVTPEKPEPKADPKPEPDLSAEEKAAKASAKALTEFTFACRTWLPKITVEADKKNARVLVTNLTANTVEIERNKLT